MSEHKQETLADIVAEMRRFGQRHWMHDEGQNVRIYAERIEAAWKREKSELEASALAVGGVVETPRHAPVGNSAAMREALVKIRRNLTMTYQSEEEERNLIVEAFNIAGEALAAPPRNCDWFKTKEEAEVEFMMSDELPRDNGDMEMRAWMCRFIDWLFAPATGQEGGRDE